MWLKRFVPKDETVFFVVHFLQIRFFFVLVRLIDGNALVHGKRKVSTGRVIYCRRCLDRLKQCTEWSVKKKIIEVFSDFFKK